MHLSIKGGGCAGFSYDWGFMDSQADITDSDELIEVEGGKLVIDRPKCNVLLGTELDYVDEV